MQQIIEILTRLEASLPGKEIMLKLHDGQPAFRVRWLQSGGGVREVRIVFPIKGITDSPNLFPDMIVDAVIRKVLSSYSQGAAPSHMQVILDDEGKTP
jgi:hypothetical protein